MNLERKKSRKMNLERKKSRKMNFSLKKAANIYESKMTLFLGMRPFLSGRRRQKHLQAFERIYKIC